MQKLKLKKTIIIFAISIVVILYSGNSYSLEIVAELYNEGNYQEAISYLQKLDSPENELEKSEKFRHLAFLYKEAGNIEKYAEILSNLYDDKPENNKIHLETAIALYQIGSYDEASVLFDELIIDIEDNSDLPISDLIRAYYYQGKTAFNREKFNKARHSWNQGLSLEEHSQFYIELGNLNFKLEEYESALNYYKQALETDGSLNYLYPRMADVAENLEELEKAANFWQRSMETGVHRNKAEKNLTRLRELLSEPKPELKPEEKVSPEVEAEETWKPVWQDTEPIEGHHNSPKILIKTGTSREELMLKFNSSFAIVTDGGDTVASGNPYETWKISIDENEFNIISLESEKSITLPAERKLIFQSSNNNSTYMLHNVIYGQDYYWAGREDRQYRGDLIIFPGSSQKKFTAVNRVHLEEYLLSVVPSEMPAGWPLEALKTQALAARSFAYYNLDRRHQDDPYDLCDTVHCAVYSGINSETESTNRAVIETIGEMGVHNGEVIEAVFSSNSGGHTEAASEIWGGESSYLTGTNLQLESNYDFPLLPAEMQDWVTRRVNTYSGPGEYSYQPAYRWVRRLDAEFLQESFDLDKIEEIFVKQRTSNGFVKNIRIEGGDETIEISGDSIRSNLGGLRSNKFVIQKEYSPEGEIQTVSFYGAGWGHGVGMDQTASAHMAEDGMNYKEIFNQFYQDIKVEKIY